MSDLDGLWRALRGTVHWLLASNDPHACYVLEPWLVYLMLGAFLAAGMVWRFARRQHASGHQP
jgi:hypothetical protein